MKRHRLSQCNFLKKHIITVPFLFNRETTSIYFTEI